MGTALSIGIDGGVNAKMTDENKSGGDDDGQMYMAHVRKDADGVWYEHLLNDHLQKVSRLAGGFAHTFGANEWAELAGLNGYPLTCQILS